MDADIVSCTISTLTDPHSFRLAGRRDAAVPEQVVWTRKLIERFWNGLAETPVLDKLSFGRLAGPSVVALARPHVPKGTRCLDYGGGDGDVAEILIAEGYPSACFEPSPLRAGHIVERLGERDGFIGVIGRDTREQFEALFCLEVIEHVLETEFTDFLRDLNGRLVDGGILVLTCPSDEDLDVSLVYCPVCDSAFHRWQHLRSLTARTVRDLLIAAGFETIWQGLVGFSTPDAITEFLSHDNNTPWPNNLVLAPGDAIPIIGPPERIMYIGRKVRAAGELPARRILRLLAAPQDRSTPESEAPSARAALERARLAAKPAAVALPAATSEEVSEDVRVVVVPGAFPSRAREAIDGAEAPAHSGGEAPVHSDGSALQGIGSIVYPGPLTDYYRARMIGWLPDAGEIHVFERGTWLTVRQRLLPAAPVLRRATARPDLAHASVRVRAAQFADMLWAKRERHLREALHGLARHSLARRLQQFVDGRERGLSTLLSDPPDFPHRLSHVVEKRIVLAISSLYSGGAERQAVYTAAGLRGRSINDVHMLVEHLHNDTANAFYLEAARNAAATVTELSNAENPHKAWVRQHPALFSVLHDHLGNRVLNAAAYLQRVAPEIVHASLDWTNVTIGIAAVLAGVPRVFLSGRNLSPFHFGFFNWFLYPAYRALAQQPNVQLLNNSAAGASDYAGWLNIPADRVKVLRNGFDPSRFPRISEPRRRQARVSFGVPAESKIVAGAFRLSGEKRPLLWIEAAARIGREDPNVLFLLFGDGPLRYQTKQLAWSLGIGDRVFFPGIAKDIAFAFSAADLVMLTSLKEGTPNVLIEAQAMGLPVVTTAAYGGAEAVNDGLTGRVVRNETADEIASAALAVLRDGGFRARAAQAGPDWVERRFGMARMIDDTLRAYAAAGASWAAELVASDATSS
jgi:glycosyltransferase involved in cell wall biosynthesis